MSFLKSVCTVGGFTVVSRLLGMVRENLFAHVVGAGAVSDAFIIAFKFPNFFRRFFAEGAFSAAYVPEFSRVLTVEGRPAAQLLGRHTFMAMLLFLCVFTAFFEVFMPWLVSVFAPGLSRNPAGFELTVTLARITFPYILFISLSTFFAGTLNALNYFTAAAAAPIILNSVMIASLYLFPENAVFPLSYAVVLSGAVQILWLGGLCARHGFSVRPLRPRLTPALREILRKTGPGMIGAGVMQLNIFIDLTLASFLPQGAISYLYYADRLNQLPLSVFGIALGTVLLPLLSKAVSTDDTARIRKYQSRSLEAAWLLVLPCAAGLFLTAEPVIGLIYGHGSFTAEAAAATYPALQAFAAGLPAYVVAKILVTVFFARKDTKTPVKIGAVCVAFNLLLNLTMIFALKAGHTGMAAATTVSAWLQALLLGLTLYRRKLLHLSRSLAAVFAYAAAGAVLMGMLTVYMRGLLPWDGGSSLPHKIAGLAAVIAAAAIFYGAWCYLGYRRGVCLAFRDRGDI